jgi:hypothetical protein
MPPDVDGRRGPSLLCNLCTRLWHDNTHRNRAPIGGVDLHGTFCGLFLFDHKSQGWFDDAQLSSLLLDNVDAFEAGAPFPDWGYRLETQHQRTVYFS